MGGAGAPNPRPSEKSQNIGCLCNAGQDPLKNHKATKPALNVGPTFKWRFAGGPLIARL